jgi:signal-transduction protein with cAMP-binding, CBS, and nucleotidyltransferase domain
MLRSALASLLPAIRVSAQQTERASAAGTLRWAQTQPQRGEKLSEATSNSAFSNITISQVMKNKSESGAPTSALFWVQPHAKVYEAIEIMAKANVGSILVMESGHPHKSQVQGIITERDYLRKVVVAGKSSKEMACAALMTKTDSMLTLKPEDTVAKVFTHVYSRELEK